MARDGRKSSSKRGSMEQHEVVKSERSAASSYDELSSTREGKKIFESTNRTPPAVMLEFQDEPHFSTMAMSEDDPDHASSERQLIEQELLLRTRLLLEAIGTRNWEQYELLCSRNMSCFEPETAGSSVTGLQFHQFYFEMDDVGEGVSTSQHAILNPSVSVLGRDVGYIHYTRMTQTYDPYKGSTRTDKSNETRIWQRTSVGWQCVHFHKTDAGYWEGRAPGLRPVPPGRAPAVTSRSIPRTKGIVVTTSSQVYNDDKSDHKGMLSSK